MITLSPAFRAALDEGTVSPVLLVEILVYTGTVDGVPQYETHRATDSGRHAQGGVRGYLFGGDFYPQYVCEDVKISMSMGQAIDSLTIVLDNCGADRPWSLLYNTTPIHDWMRSRVKVYRTLVGQAERIQVYDGYLELPDSVSDKFELVSRQLLDSILVEFPSVDYSRTCPWVPQFAQGRRCNYSGVETSCGGTFADCTDRGMTHRFGGIRSITLTGQYTYKEQRRFWFDRRRTGTYKSEETTTLLGACVPVVYGTVRVEADVAWFLDTGPVNKYVALLGWGVIGGFIDAPDLGRRDISNPSSRNPAIVYDNKRMKDYDPFFGWDGSPGYSDPHTWTAASTGQQIDYLWNNAPAYLPTYVEGDGQTYSRLAYIIGCAPSTDAKEADRVGTIEVYLRGRMLDTYYGSDTVSDRAGATLPTYNDDYDANPAWVVLDILTNQDYGAGLALSHFDIPSFRIAAYLCNSEGFRFCHSFKERLKVDEAVQLVLNACRGYLAYRNGQYRITVQTREGMTSEAAVHAFDASQILLDSDAYMVGARDAKSNQVEVGYIDYDQDYQIVPRILDDLEHQQAWGKIERHGAQFVGCVGFDQANKIAHYALNSTRIERRKDGMKRVAGDLRLLHLEIGDIVSVDNSDLDLQDPAVDPEEYDGRYQVVEIEWNGDEALLLLRRADPAMFDATGIAPDVDILPVRSRTRYPRSVVNATVTEDATDLSRLVVRWEMPPADIQPGEDPYAPDPVWVDISWKRDTEEPYQRRSVARVWATDGLYHLEIPDDALWNETIDVYLASVSGYGVVQPCDPTIDGLNQTTLTADADDAGTTWSVDDPTVWDLGGGSTFALAICGSEVVSIASLGTDSLTLVAEADDPATRQTYNRTIRRRHRSGDPVGWGVPIAVVVSALIRPFSLVGDPLDFVVTADGPLFTARYSNPVYSIPGRDVEIDGPLSIPDSAIDHWELCYSWLQDFDPTNDATPASTFVRDISGPVHEKHGYDPTGAYYWAIRCQLVDESFTDWVFYLKDPVDWGYSGSPPVPDPTLPISRRLVSARQVATMQREGSATAEALVLREDSTLQGIDLQGAAIATEWGDDADTLPRLGLSTAGLRLWRGSRLTFFMDAATGSWRGGNLSTASTASTPRIVYDAVADTLTITGAEYSGGTVVVPPEGDTGGILLCECSWTGDGATTAYTLPALRYPLSAVFVSVNGLLQRITASYTVSDGASYTTVTFTWAPGSGDIITCWYQVGAAVGGQSLTSRARLTTEGALATKLIAGEALSAGEVVYVPQTGASDRAVVKCPASGAGRDMPVGVVYADAANGADVWVVTSGAVPVLPASGVTAAKGYVIYASGTTAGRVDQSPTAPTNDHWREIGHFLTQGSGAGVATEAIVHFN